MSKKNAKSSAKKAAKKSTPKKVSKATPKKTANKSAAKPAKKIKPAISKKTAKVSSNKSSGKKNVSGPAKKAIKKPIVKKAAPKKANKVKQSVKKAPVKKVTKATAVKKAAPRKAVPKKVVAKAIKTKSKAVPAKPIAKKSLPLKPAPKKEIVKTEKKAVPEKKAVKAIKSESKVVEAKKLQKDSPQRVIIAPVEAPKPKVAEKINEKPAKEPAGKFELEYVIHTSTAILFEFLTTPSGLSEWFCDDVNIRNEIYTFMWEGADQPARLIKLIEEKLVRFQWIERTDGAYFEFRIDRDDLTNDISLIVTDFAENEAEKESSKLLWDSQVEKLMKVLGSSF